MIKLQFLDNIAQNLQMLIIAISDRLDACLFALDFGVL